MKRVVPLLALLAALVGAGWLLFGEDEAPQGGYGSDPFFGEPAAGDGDLLTGADARPLGSDPTSLQAAAGGEGGREAATRTARVVGRVVDAARHPVADVAVQLSLPRQRPVLVQSDAQGRYAFEMTTAPGGARQRGTLFARAADGRVATDLLWVPGGAWEGIGPTLVLDASARLLVRVLREEAPVPGAQVTATRRMGGMPSVLATRTCDSEGRVLLEGLPTGGLEIFAAAPGSGRGHASVVLPREETGPLELRLGEERRLEVLVVDARSDRPVSGAEVLPGDAQTMPDPYGPGYVPLWRSVRTDRAGRVVLTGLAADGYALAPWWMGGGRGVPAETKVHRIALTRAREVSFPVSAGGSGPPPDGARLRVELMGAGSRLQDEGLHARMQDGQLWVRGLPARPVNGVVVAPEGAQASFQAPAGADMGSVVTFFAPRSVTLRAVSPEGAAQPDVLLRLDPLGRGARIPAQRTDGAGEATFIDVGSDQVAVFLAVPDQPGAGILLTRLELSDEKDLYEVELQERQALTVEVRIGEEPRLPARYTLMVGERRVGAADLEEDPTRGLLRAWIRPAAGDAQLAVALHADGYQPVATSVVPGAEESVTLVLEPAGSLAVDVTPPADGVFSVRLERFDPATEAWGPAQAQGGGAQPAVELVGASGGGGPGGVQRFDGLVGGRYRAVDGRSGTHSAAVDVTPGVGTQRVALDLSGSAWIEGRVRAPVGTDLSRARVLVRGRDDPGNVWAGVRPNPEGVFKLRGRSGEALALHVTHPTLRPAAQGGEVRARPGSGPVELRLENGPTTQFRLEGFAAAGSEAPGAWLSPVRVHLQDPKSGAIVHTVQPSASGGLFTFGGYAPGTYQVRMVFSSRHAPLVVPAVTLGEGPHDLGTLVPSSGETLVLRLQPTPPDSASVWMTATHLGDPEYIRQGARDKRSGVVRCEGLGPGRFRILVRGANLAPGSTMSRVLYEGEITSSGTGEQTLDIPTR